MTLPRLNAMKSYWLKYPPLHIVVAGFVGAGQPVRNTPTVAPDFDDQPEFEP